MDSWRPACCPAQPVWPWSDIHLGHQSCGWPRLLDKSRRWQTKGVGLIYDTGLQSCSPKSMAGASEVCLLQTPTLAALTLLTAPASGAPAAIQRVSQQLIQCGTSMLPLPSTRPPAPQRPHVLQQSKGYPLERQGNRVKTGDRPLEGTTQQPDNHPVRAPVHTHYRVRQREAGANLACMESQVMKGFIGAVSRAQ